MVTKSLIGVLLIATTACATETQTGTAVGAGGGALIGGLAGGSTGAIVGAALGGLLGYGVGRTQEIENERRLQASLDAGQPMSWSNPSGFAYTSQPGPVFYQGPTPCRDFTVDATVDAFAFRVRDDGTLAWSRIYVGERAQGFSGVTATRDGNVAAVGTDHWNYVGPRQVPLIARIDAATGSLLWAKKLTMTRYAYMSRITETEDGTLWAAGGAQGIITSTGAALVVRIGADGSDVRHAMFFEDEDWEAAVDSAWNGSLDFASWVDTAGGDTAYDIFLDIAPHGDGVVVAGVTGLGASTAARAAKVTAKLGVEWMSVLDVAKGDSLTTLAMSDTALLVSGVSASLPQAGTGVADNQIWVTKLPVTGSVTLLPPAAMTVRYSAPGIRASSTDAKVVPVSDTAIDATLTLEDPLLLSGGANPGLLMAGSARCVRRLTETGTAPQAGACL